jgi:hypothetical protein
MKMSTSGSTHPLFSPIFLGRFSPWFCLAPRHVDGRNVGLGFENGQRHGKKHSFYFFLSLLTGYRTPPLRFLVGMKRAPQPLALLQDSYRQIDDLNGLRWAFEGMQTQVKKVSR